MRSRLTSILAAGALLVGLTGCTFTADQTVQTPYDPSDGVGTNVGDIDVRNVLLVTDDGETANLLVSLINTGPDDVEMAVSWETVAGRVERTLPVASGTTESFGDSSNQLILQDLDAQPGSLFPIYFQYGSQEGRELRAPVLDGQLEEYRELVPSPEISPSPSSSIAVSPSVSPQPSASPSPSDSPESE